MNDETWGDYAPPSQFTNDVAEAQACIKAGDFWSFRGDATVSDAQNFGVFSSPEPSGGIIARLFAWLVG